MVTYYPLSTDNIWRIVKPLWGLARSFPGDYREKVINLQAQAILA